MVELRKTVWVHGWSSSGAWGGVSESVLRQGLVLAVLCPCHEAWAMYLQGPKQTEEREAAPQSQGQGPAHPLLAGCPNGAQILTGK